MKQLTALIISLEEKIPFLEIENNQVSNAKAGWHVQHSLMVVNSITKGLLNSDPESYKWKFNLARTYVFAIGKIPRGRGKAPKAVQPSEEVTASLLLASVEKAKENIALLGNLNKNQYFLHPYFGHLNLKPTIKFLKIHTQHHLDIINDILKVKA
jgi:hypothetical protein